MGDPPMAAFSLPLRLSAGGIGTRFNTWRSRLIADARFQRWAAASPLTRRLARRKARALFDLCAGFVYSQILRACVQLEVFELLRGGPKDLDWLAARMRLTVPAARRLLSGAASLRLLRALPGDRFALDDLGASVNGNPAITAFVDHHDLLYADLKDPVALLRGEVDTNLFPVAPAPARAAVRPLAHLPATRRDGDPLGLVKLQAARTRGRPTNSSMRRVQSSGSATRASYGTSRSVPGGRTCRQ